MAESHERPLPRAQFADTRTPVRRLQATWHADEQTIVFSLWQGDRCTATFRMPVQDAPRLIALLADAFGEIPPIVSKDGDGAIDNVVDLDNYRT